jgi:hypothetical protein
MIDTTVTVSTLTFEDMCFRITDLEAQWTLLQDQTYLIEQLFALLDKTEETDDGTVFHPNQLRSCRASDTEKLNKILAELRGLMKGQKDD